MAPERRRRRRRHRHQRRTPAGSGKWKGVITYGPSRRRKAAAAEDNGPEAAGMGSSKDQEDAPQEEPMEQEQQQEAPDDARLTFPGLPTELKLKIFTYLSVKDKLLRTPLVCAEWHRLSGDPGVWKCLHLTGEEVGREEAAALARKMSMLRMLWIEHCANPDDLLDAVAESCPDFKFLVMNHITTRRKDTMVNFAKRCENLERVLFHNFNQPEGSKHLIDTLSVCSKLHTVSVRVDRNVTESPEAALGVVTGYASLRTFYYPKPSCDAEIQAVVDHCGWRLRELAVGPFQEEESYQLVQRCPNLQGLILLSPHRISDRSLLDDVGSLRHLKQLAISGRARRLSSEALVTFFSTSATVGRLQKLVLCYVNGVDDSVANAIVAHCRNLTHLHLSETQVTVKAVERIVMGLPHLKRLFVCGLGLDEVDEAGFLVVRPGLRVIWKPPVR